MSIRVPVHELAERLPAWGAAAVITSSADGARVVALIPIVIERASREAGEDGAPTLRFADPGRSAIANVAGQPSVTLYYAPNDESDGYSLIVDGVGSVEGQDLVVRPTSAVLHRPPPTP